MRRVEMPVRDLHVFICVRDRDSPKPCCAGKMPLADYKRLRSWCQDNYGERVKLTRAQCFSICPEKGFMVLFHPMQEYYEVNHVDEIQHMIQEKMA